MTASRCCIQRGFLHIFVADTGEILPEFPSGIFSSGLRFVFVFVFVFVSVFVFVFGVNWSELEG